MTQDDVKLLWHAAYKGTQKANSLGILDLDEVASGTMVRVLDGGHDLATMDRPLLYTMAHREAVDQVRFGVRGGIPVDFTDAKDRPTQGAAVERQYRPNAVEDPADAVVEKDGRDRLWAILRQHVEGLMRRLNPGQQAAAALYYLEGLDMAAAAVHLGVTQKAVRRRLEKARDSLGDQAQDLQLVRQYLHPDAKTPQTGGQGASADLRALLADYSPM